jgi:hypothetical protein
MRAGGRTDMTEPIAAFHDTTSAFKNSDCVHTQQSILGAQTVVRGAATESHVECSTKYVDS